MILVFGKTGQVGRQLARAHDVVALDRGAGDLTDPAACARAIHRLAPRAVINAAAFTDVDGAEDHQEMVHLINAQAPGAMAVACGERAIPFVQISTDYVFDGTGHTPWVPDAPVNPINTYGHSKSAAEDAVRQAGGTTAILRTSWVFSPQGRNFVTTMLRLGRQHDELGVVADQHGGPTPAADIAAACLTIARDLCDTPDASGTYHFSGVPDVSWADFAREVFAAAAMPTNVRDIATSDFPTQARRPANSRLNCDTLSTFGLTRPDWRQALRHMLSTTGSPQ